MTGLDFDGVAIGGLSVGEPVDTLLAMTAASVTELPDDRPRYFMGLGTTPSCSRRSASASTCSTASSRRGWRATAAR